MRALVYGGSGDKFWTSVADPMLVEPRDVIIRVDLTTISGLDLRTLRGDASEVRPGRILGREAVGTVMEVGDAISGLSPGDRLLVSCVSACGACAYCQRRRFGQCLGGGGQTLGRLIHGVHAEYARVPFADLSTFRLPPSVSDFDAVLLSEVLPTAYEVGVLNGGVGPGDTVVVIGAGPIGLATILTARLFSPAHIIVIDPVKSRLEAAKLFGADLAVTSQDNVLDLVRSVTDGLGADTVVEAVGKPSTFELATALIRPGGRVANVGVHGRPAALHLEDLWSRDLTITTGLVDTYSTPRLLGMLAAGLLDVGNMITHRFDLTEISAAYDLVARATQSGALKVALVRN